MKPYGLISSRKNAFFRQLVNLNKSSRKRSAAGLTLLDGAHLIGAYRRAIGVPKKIIIAESHGENPELARLLVELEAAADVDLLVLSDSMFREASPVRSPTGIMALISIPTAGSIPVIKGSGGEPFYVLLEAIQDSGNLGSILRSAAAAGASDVYLSSGCADVWSPKVLRAAMGAHFSLHIHEHSDLINIARTFKRTFKGKVVATTLKTRASLYQAQMTGAIALVFGNEGQGLSEAVLEAATERIRIPMQNSAESLNAAAAAAVCFFERVRQLHEELRETPPNAGPEHRAAEGKHILPEN
jgi:RNA methyltransferase, TrmH family